MYSENCHIPWQFHRKAHSFHAQNLLIQDGADLFGIESLKSLSAILGVQPSVVLSAGSPNVIVDTDRYNDIKSLGLDSSEGIENSIVKSSMQRLVSTGRNAISNNVSLTGGF